MIFKSKYIAVIILLACSCGTKMPDFSENETSISGQVVEVGCMVGKATEIVCIDSLLLYHDRYDNLTVTVYDTKNHRLVGRFLKAGKGSGEVLVPLKLFVSPVDDKIYIFQIQTGSLHESTIKEVADGKIETAINEKRVFEDRPFFLKRSKNNIVGIGIFGDSRFHIYDRAGKLTDAVGEYPFRGQEMPPVDRFMLYQGAICASPGGDYFAMGSSYCDNLEFYRIEETGGASLVQKYGTYDVKVQYNQRVRIQDDCVMNYKSAYGTDRYCYMLYSGETYAEKGRKAHGGQRIMVFDWNGKYIKSFAMGMTVVSFCVSENDDVIYAVTEEEEYNIRCFQL